MSERRSSRRQRRTVDYRQFADKASEDDDDFESSPVPHKKPKVQQGRDGARTPTDKAVEQKEQESDLMMVPTKARPSRDERKFGKDTERAMEVSATAIIGDGHPSPGLPPSRDSVGNGKDRDYEPEDGDEGEVEEFISGPAESSDDDFSVPSPPQKKTKPAAKPVAKAKRASTATPKTEATERIRGREGKTASGKVVCRTKQGTVKPSCQPPPTLSSNSNTCTVMSPGSPLPSTPGLGMRRMAKWTPPGPSGREDTQHTKTTMNIGGTPVVRVGLSRNARVKPLHNSCHN